MRLTRRQWISVARFAICLLPLVGAGCETTGWGKKSSPLSTLLEANGFKQKTTTFTLIGDAPPPNDRLVLTEKKHIWNSLREAYPIANWRGDDFYDIELESEGKIDHLYVRNQDGCALYFRDLPVGHPDFAKDDPRLYFVSPGMLHILLAETSKAPVEPGKAKGK